MQTTLGELATLVAGQVSGAPETPITGASIVREAAAGHITFAESPRLIAQAESTSAAALIVGEESPPPSLPHIVVPDVTAAFTTIVSHFRPPTTESYQGVSAAAQVSRTAKIGRQVTIAPGTVIGDHVEIGDGATIHSGVHIMAGCRLGRDVTVFPRAVLYEDTQVGDRVVIHAGAVIGAYGFGYKTHQGRHELSPQVGYVELHDDVEVGANTTIDRGTFGPTVIGEGTKLDNQVMVAHNCRIGKHNLICSQVGIAGSCTTGDYVVMAGQVGVRDHIVIGDRVRIGAQSGVARDVPSDAHVLGSPAKAERETLQETLLLGRLGEMRRQVKRLVSWMKSCDGGQPPKSNGAGRAAASEEHSDAA